MGNAVVRRTGLVELYRTTTSLTVAANTLGQVIDLNPINYSAITIMVRADGAHVFQPKVQFRRTGTTPPLGSGAPAIPYPLLGGEDTLRGITDWIYVLADRAVIYINNQDAVSHDYDVTVYGKP